MGNYRFRISDMMPNAWFYRLKDMSRTKIHGTSRPTAKNLSSSATMSQQPRLYQPQQSYCYTVESSKRDKHYNSQANTKALETHFPPRRSKKKKTKRKTVYKPSPLRQTTSSPSASDCSFRASVNSIWIEPEPFWPQNYFDSSAKSSAEFDLIKSSSSDFESDNFDSLAEFNGPGLRSSSCSCRFKSSATDIAIDVNERSYTRTVEKLDDFRTISEVDLPPIRTKPVNLKDASGAARCRSSSELKEKQAHGSLYIKIIEDERINTRKENSASPATRKSSTASPTPPGKSITTCPAPRESITASPAPRKSISQSTGVKVRANATKQAGKRCQVQGRKSLSSNKCRSGKKTFTDSFAIVKASFDPVKDLRDSMMEMIADNNIQASKDLEELLACYLSLNSAKYHELIVKAFEEIWFCMPQIQL